VFGSIRIFSQLSAESGLNEWFFLAREGVFGPYPNKELALNSLNAFVDTKVNALDDGGRSTGGQQLSLAPLEHEHPTVYDPSKRKKGLDD
jgi:hypothetical protein